jgi:IS1 family transposase
VKVGSFFPENIVISYNSAEPNLTTMVLDFFRYQDSIELNGNRLVRCNHAFLKRRKHSPRIQYCRLVKVGVNPVVVSNSELGKPTIDVGRGFSKVNERNFAFLNDRRPIVHVKIDTLHQKPSTFTLNQGFCAPSGGFGSFIGNTDRLHQLLLLSIHRIGLPLNGCQCVFQRSILALGSPRLTLGRKRKEKTCQRNGKSCPNVSVVPGVFLNVDLPIFEPCDSDRDITLFAFGCFALVVAFGYYGILRIDAGRRSGWWLIECSALLFCVGLTGMILGSLPWRWSRCLKKERKRNNSSFDHGQISYPNKYILTSPDYWGTVFIGGGNQMANMLSTEKQAMVIGALAEGSSIRSIERMTGVHRDTIMRLGVKVGQGCTALLDHKMRNLACEHLQVDEIWGFIGKKERHVKPEDDPQVGDVWTFCAIDADTKLVPTFAVGKRDRATANDFVADTAYRLTKRVQLSSDSMRSYIEAVELAFGSDVDYAQIIKEYGHDDSISPERKYSPPKVLSVEKKRISGQPDMELASTSYIERLNGTTRLHMRRLTRLTYAFSKKLDNFKAAVGLHFAYYNFVLRHSTLRCTPAMEAGLERDF